MFVKAQWPFYPPLNEEIVFTLIWLIYSYSLHTELQYGGQIEIRDSFLGPKADYVESFSS